jgi:hypothetical protein
MPTFELSRAFQTSVCTLTTNSVLAKQVVTGEIPASGLHPALTDDDVRGLHELLSAQSGRVIAVAEMLTSRRKRKVRDSLPITVRMLGGRFEAWWIDYLHGRAPPGIQPAAREAALFGAWTLSQLEPGSIEYPLARYEFCRSDVASRFLPQASTAVAPAPLGEYDCLRLTDCARVEPFDWAIDEAVMHYRRTGELKMRARGNPVHLVFHAVSSLVMAVGVTKVSPVMGLLLARSRVAVETRELLRAVPEVNRPPLLKALQKLVSIRVLDVLEPSHAFSRQGALTQTRSGPQFP